MLPRTIGPATLLLCCGLPFSVAAAKPPLEQARPGAAVQPISIAKVMKVNGQIVLAGEWMPYTGFSTRAYELDVPFFDCYGRSPATAGGDCIPGTDCVPSCQSAPDGGSRWYFGSAYHNPNTIEDMQDCACPPGSVISEIDLGFFWCPSTVGENCIIIYFPLEEVTVFPADCPAGVYTDTGGGGVALNYGALPPGCPFYYYSCVVGIESLGILSPATDDNGDANGYADGSYQQIIANAITSTAITLAVGPAQPMLWGTSTSLLLSTGPADCRPGYNNEDSLDDDAPTDGTFTAGECYSYAFGCPDPLGKMNAFCYLRCPADYNYDGFVDGIDSDQFNNDFESGSSCADLNGDCFVDGIDSDYFNNEFSSDCDGSAPPCPASSGPPFNSQAYLVTGNATGVGWSWTISSNTPPPFIASVSSVPGISGGSPPIDLAAAFASSINAFSIAQGCGPGRLSATAQTAGSEAYLLIRIGGTQPFTLSVGPLGGAANDPCTPTCFFNPRMDRVPPSGQDCNGNGVDDAMDIALKTSFDSNQNGEPDECETFCPADYNQDTFVDGIDYDSFFNDFESTDPDQQMNADFNNDGFVDGIDSDGFNNSYERGC